jgi:hypothetical protein
MPMSRCPIPKLQHCAEVERGRICPLKLVGDHHLPILQVTRETTCANCANRRSGSTGYGGLEEREKAREPSKLSKAWMEFKRMFREGSGGWVAV